MQMIIALIVEKVLEETFRICDRKKIMEAQRQYAKAYEAHYTTKDFEKAIKIYKEILHTYPNSQEAGYSRTQIDNIVKSVVPREKLLETLLNLAKMYL